MTYIPPGGQISDGNSTEDGPTRILGIGATFTGPFEDVTAFGSITIIGKSDVIGTLFADFSSDGVVVDHSEQLSDGTTTDFGEHGLIPIAQFFRLRVVNGAVGATNLRIQTLFHTSARIAILTTRLAQDLSDHSDVLNARSVLVGKDDGGTFRNIGTDGDRVKVSVRSPIEAFGAVMIAGLLPQVQRKWSQGLNSFLDDTIDHEGGTVTADNGLLTLNTSGSTSSVAQYQSSQIVSDRPGQAVVARFTMLFTTGVVGTSQVIGIGDPEDGFFFGFDGDTFGICHRRDGQVEIRTLTVTGAPGSAGNVTVTLNGDAVVTALDGTESIAEAAAKIAASNYDTAGGGWYVRYGGNTVTFLAIDTATRGGAYSFVDTGGTGATATGPVQSLAAVAADDTWHHQSTWNRDHADGQDMLPALDFTLGQVAQIEYQSGFGIISFRLEDPATGLFVLVHQIEYANTETSPSLQQPDLRLHACANNKATTADLTLCTAGMGSYLAGEPIPRLGLRFTEANEKSTGTTRVNILVLRVKNVVAGATNRIRIFLDSITLGDNSLNRTGEFRLTKNPTLVGSPSFTDVDGANSVMEVDTATTSIVAGTGNRSHTDIIGSVDGRSRDLDGAHVVELEPGDILVVDGALAAGGAAAGLVAGLSWLEGV